MVTLTEHDAPAAKVTLLHPSADATMIAGCDNVIAPVFMADAFGLLKMTLAVVD